MPSGLDAPTAYGKRISPKLQLAMLDDRALGLPNSAKAGAPVVVYPVANPDKIVRSDSRSGQVVVAGDGEGLVDASALGILDGKGAILYSAPDAKSPKDLRRVVSADPDATLLVTDSNRRRAERWTALSEIFGYTERAGEKPLKKDTSDQRLPLFPGAGATHCVVEQQTTAARNHLWRRVIWIHARRPRDARVRRRRHHGVAGRGSCGASRGAHRRRHRRADHDRPRQPRPAAHWPTRRMDHQGDAPLRRRRSDHGGSRRSVAHSRGSDRDLPPAHVPSARDHDRLDEPGGRNGDDAQLGRVRRDPLAGRRCRRATSGSTKSCGCPSTSSTPLAPARRIVASCS